MSDQMTPDAMRKAAKRLREEAAGFAEVNPADNVIPTLAAGTDALDRLADVIEYAERIAGSNRADSPYPFERYAHEGALRTLAFARGETNERESNA